jgi:hypothetical protein
MPTPRRSHRAAEQYHLYEDSPFNTTPEQRKHPVTIATDFDQLPIDTKVMGYYGEWWLKTEKGYRHIPSEQYISPTPDTATSYTLPVDENIILHSYQDYLHIKQLAVNFCNYATQEEKTEEMHKTIIRTGSALEFARQWYDIHNQEEQAIQTWKSIVRIMRTYKIKPPQILLLVRKSEKELSMYSAHLNGPRQLAALIMEDAANQTMQAQGLFGAVNRYPIQHRWYLLRWVLLLIGRWAQGLISTPGSEPLVILCRRIWAVKGVQEWVGQPGTLGPGSSTLPKRTRGFTAPK